MGFKAVFRCDASRDIGSGHVYRCMSLADELQKNGWNIAFAAAPESASIVPALKEKFALHGPDYKNACDLLVVDHYGLDATYERTARGWAKRIAVIDDLADRAHECDILIDTTYGRRNEDYKKLAPENCTLLCGADYAMLRPQFAALREESLKRRTKISSPPRVLISLGSTNIGNATGKVLAALESYPGPLNLDVVMGSGAAHLDEIKVPVHIDTPDMAGLMARTDIAIGAGGTTSWERCCLGLPTILIELADNQSLIAQQLHMAGAVINIGLLADLTPEKIHAALDDILAPAKHKAMTQAASMICDGRGTSRIVPLLYPPHPGKNGKSISLRAMNSGDEEILLGWQSHPDTRKFARTPAPPAPDEHAAWMKKILADEGAHPYIILADGQPCGHIRLNKRDGFFEISLLVDPAQYGLGIGLGAISCLHDVHGRQKIRAEILSGNAASVALFMKAGYKHLHDTWYEYERI